MIANNNSKRQADFFSKQYLTNSSPTRITRKQGLILNTNFSQHIRHVWHLAIRVRENQCHETGTFDDNPAVWSTSVSGSHVFYQQQTGMVFWP